MNLPVTSSIKISKKISQQKIWWDRPTKYLRTSSSSFVEEKILNRDVKCERSKTRESENEKKWWMGKLFTKVPKREWENFLRDIIRTGAKQKFVSNLILKIFSTMWHQFRV